MKKQNSWCLGLKIFGAVVALAGTPHAGAVLASSSLDYRSRAAVSNRLDPTTIFDQDTVEAGHVGTSPLNLSGAASLAGGTASYELAARMTPVSISASGRAEFSVGGDIDGGASNRWEFDFVLNEPALLSISGSGSVVTPPNNGGLIFGISKTNFPRQFLAGADTRSGSLDFGAIWGGTRELEAGRYAMLVSGATGSQRNGSALVLADGFAELDINLTFSAVGALDGDYNGDGFVSQADLDLVLLNWGASTVPAAWTATDQFDGVQVSQNELDGVLLNWGDGAPPTVAVPEPASAVLLGLLVAAALPRGRRGCYALAHAS